MKWPNKLQSQMLALWRSPEILVAVHQPTIVRPVDKRPPQSDRPIERLRTFEMRVQKSQNKLDDRPDKPKSAFVKSQNFLSFVFVCGIYSFWKEHSRLAISSTARGTAQIMWRSPQSRFVYLNLICCFKVHSAVCDIVTIASKSS